jgi:hypothetical protein
VSQHKSKQQAPCTRATKRSCACHSASHSAQAVFSGFVVNVPGDSIWQEGASKVSVTSLCLLVHSQRAAGGAAASGANCYHTCLLLQVVAARIRPWLGPPWQLNICTALHKEDEEVLGSASMVKVLQILVRLQWQPPSEASLAHQHMPLRGDHDTVAAFWMSASRTVHHAPAGSRPHKVIPKPQLALELSSCMDHQVPQGKSSSSLSCWAGGPASS